MAKSYADFMAVGDIKEMQSGEQALAAQKTLSKAFCKSAEKQDFDEQMIFDGLVEYAMKTKIGREIMTEVAELGYSFAFEASNAGGRCDDQNKRITLNPNCGFDYLLPVLVHEGQHAIQNKHFGSDVYMEHMEAATFFKKYRSIEADATAHEMAFLCELKDIYPAPYEAEKARGSAMLDSYETEKSKSGDEKKALGAAFKAWYKDKSYCDFYDKYYTETIEMISDFGIKNNVTDCFATKLSSKKILECCLYQGKPYINPSFLESDLAFSIHAQDQKKILAATEKYAKSVDGAVLDKSVEKMAIHDDARKIVRSSMKNAALNSIQKGRE